ncbi:hypothetical protein PoB_003653500 [Plakobranchus ocellatus]|uniref:Uncharacterized protein n=1 Tax=Plakobranchus ocellatus TaxID=259542 RepID=A0AAV4AP35_9GAST|nr:hypothetical protein PoB_003653500 [Plakobranchus ocellatus]
MMVFRGSAEILGFGSEEEFSRFPRFRWLPRLQLNKRAMIRGVLRNENSTTCDLPLHLHTLVTSQIAKPIILSSRDLSSYLIYDPAGSNQRQETAMFTCATLELGDPARTWGTWPQSSRGTVTGT